MASKNDTDDASWVLESLVGFLKGPVWNLSILNFIEQKSVSKYYFVSGLFYKFQN